MNKRWKIYNYTGGKDKKTLEGIFLNEKNAKLYMRFLIFYYYEDAAWKLEEEEIGDE